jgi:hypothetical protein
MPFTPPFRLGPFEVDSEGRLSPVVHEASPAFLFRWRDRVVRSRLALTDATAGRLMMRTVVGRVPSPADRSPNSETGSQVPDISRLLAAQWGHIGGHTFRWQR